MLPHGAEAVVPVEWTDGGTTRVTIRGQAERGNAIRLAGGDAQAGEVLVGAGTMLRPMHIAVIAAAGRGAVQVRPRPRVMVLSTGSELAEPGTPIIPGRIWDSNSFMIAAAAREAGCLAYRQAIVPDHPEQVLPEATAMAHRIAALPPQAVQDTKSVLNQHLRMAAVTVLGYGLAAESQSHDTPEYRAVPEKMRARKG